jgi:hypothetical protein
MVDNIICDQYSNQVSTSLMMVVAIVVFSSQLIGKIASTAKNHFVFSSGVFGISLSMKRLLV